MSDTKDPKKPAGPPAPSKPAQMPAICRQVVYRDHPDKDASEDEGEDCPATVCAAYDDGRVDLHVLLHHRINRYDNLGETAFVYGVPYTAEPVPGRWRWPARV